MPEQWLGKYLGPEMCYKVALCPGILPKSCSRVKADALSQDLFESCDWFFRSAILPTL